MASDTGSVAVLTAIMQLTQGEEMANETKKVKEEASELQPERQTFPQLIGSIVTSVLTQRANMGAARASLVSWYEQQDPTQKKDIAKKLREDMLTLKQLSEGLHSQSIEMTMSDV